MRPASHSSTASAALAAAVLVAALVVALALAATATAAETLTGPAQAIDADSLMVEGRETRLEVVDASAWDHLISGTFSVLAVIIGVALGAWLALRGYFLQKEYELVKERYLEGGIDILASELEQCLGVVRHNWSRCLNILKAFRDEKDVFDKEELSKGFLDLHLSPLNTIALYRIEGLVGLRAAQMIWAVCQTAYSEAGINNAVYTKEIPSVVRNKLTTSLVKAEPEEIVGKMFDDLSRRDEESQRFAYLTRALSRLGAILEKKKMTFKQLSEFKKRPEVKCILAEFERDFAETLADAEETLSDARRNVQQS